MTGLQLTQAGRDRLQAAEHLAKPANRARLVPLVGRRCKSAAD